MPYIKKDATPCTCTICGKEFLAKRVDAHQCSANCRNKAARARLAATEKDAHADWQASDVCKAAVGSWMEQRQLRLIHVGDYMRTHGYPRFNHSKHEHSLVYWKELHRRLRARGMDDEQARLAMAFGASGTFLD